MYYKTVHLNPSPDCLVGWPSGRDQVSQSCKMSLERLMQNAYEAYYPVSYMPAGIARGALSRLGLPLCIYGKPFPTVRQAHSR